MAYSDSDARACRNALARPVCTCSLLLAAILIVAPAGTWLALEASQTPQGTVPAASAAPQRVAPVASAAAQQAAPPGGGTGQDEPWLASLREWLAAVERHTPGQPDRDLVVFSAWPQRDLRAVVTDLTALLQLLDRAYVRFDRSGQQSTITYKGRLFSMAGVENLLGLSGAGQRRDANPLLKRAALLHTDIALLVVPEGAPPDTESVSGVVLVQDGLHAGFDSLAVHLTFARALLDLVAPSPAGDGMVRLWYQAMAASLEGRFMLGDAVPHLARAREIFPSDAAILLASGCRHETCAAPRTQSAVQALELPRGFKVDVGTAQAELGQARAFFRQALRADPGLTEARVRLARITGVQGDHEAAAGELRKAVASPADTVLLYYAWLFLGDEEQELGHRDAARDAYARAAALYPRAQTPWLALSHLARRSGDRAAALKAIQYVLALPAAARERDDPWWMYLAGQGRLAEALLAELWKPYLAGEKR